MEIIFNKDKITKVPWEKSVILWIVYPSKKELIQFDVKKYFWERK